MDKENISFGLRRVFVKAEVICGVSSWQLAVAENDDLSASSHMALCNYTFCKSKRELKQIEDRGFDGGCLFWILA